MHKAAVLFVVTALVAACADKGIGDTEVAPWDSEEYRVYGTAVLNQCSLTQAKQVILLDKTKDPAWRLDSGGPAQGPWLLRRDVQAQLGPLVEPETLTDFVIKNKREYRLESRTGLPAPVLLHSEDDLVDQFYVPHEGVWKRLREKYPDAQGIVNVSRVGFNAGKDQALLYMINWAPRLEDAGCYVLLAKKDGSWIIRSTVTLSLPRWLRHD